jgi:hypothetical protein
MWSRCGNLRVPDHDVGNDRRPHALPMMRADALGGCLEGSRE